jgi:uncharacterized protein (TIGR04255 family)
VARRREHLSHAPVREALIDVQFEERVALPAIDRFIASAESLFKSKTDLWETFVGVRGDGDGKPVSSSVQSIVGRRMDLASAPFVLQCRAERFTLSRLSPYVEWQELVTHAQDLWARLVTEIGAVTINRVGVRYINEIKMPLPFDDFGEYLTCPPEVPNELPQSISGFLTRVIIPDDAHDCVAVVTQAMEGPPLESPLGAAATVILDIDVFRAVRVTSDRMNEVWTALGVLRDQKNSIFFSHLTEKSVEMYA